MGFRFPDSCSFVVVHSLSEVSLTEPQAKLLSLAQEGDEPLGSQTHALDNVPSSGEVWGCPTSGLFRLCHPGQSQEEVGEPRKKTRLLGISVEVGMKTVLKLHILFSSSSTSANPFDSPSNHFPPLTTFLQDHQEAHVQEAPFLFYPKRHHPHRL